MAIAPSFLLFLLLTLLILFALFLLFIVVSLLALGWLFLDNLFYKWDDVAALSLGPNPLFDYFNIDF